jgi:hypothetical protein
VADTLYPAKKIYKKFFFRKANKCFGVCIVN